MRVIVRPLPIVVAVTAVLTSAAATNAVAGGRPNDTTRSWFGEISGGWAFAQGDAGDVLDDDFVLSGGALFWPSDWAVGLQLQGAYFNPDISSEAIAAINDAIDQDPSNDGRIDDGDVETWQFTVNAIWGPGEADNGFYVTGGVGAYHLEGTLTQEGLVYYPPVCDPWYWWWCYPGGIGPGNIVRGSDSTTEFGWNAGVGYAFESGTGGQFFVEAKYHIISTDSEDLEILPITFGYRW